jgi:hypothetical protein
MKFKSNLPLLAFIKVALPFPGSFLLSKLMSEYQYRVLTNQNICAIFNPLVLRQQLNTPLR